MLIDAPKFVIRAASINISFISVFFEWFEHSVMSQLLVKSSKTQWIRSLSAFETSFKPTKSVRPSSFDIKYAYSTKDQSFRFQINKLNLSFRQAVQCIVLEILLTAILTLFFNRLTLMVRSLHFILRLEVSNFLTFPSLLTSLKQQIGAQRQKG